MTPTKLLQTCLLILSFNGFAQFNLNTEKSPEMNYEIKGSYKRFVKKEVLNKAESMRDLLPGYPDNWITTYVFSEIATYTDGKKLSAMSKNDILSKEQKNLLRLSEVSNHITLTIKYKYRDPLSQLTEENVIQVDMNVIPDNEAEYTNGYKELINYFKKAGTEKLDEFTVKQIKRIHIKFTVNETGEITQVELIKGCGIDHVDKLFIELVTKMSAWKPAQNANGVKVKQRFEFLAGNALYGC